MLTSRLVPTSQVHDIAHVLHLVEAQLGMHTIWLIFLQS